jgi:hypothetical protein
MNIMTNPKATRKPTRMLLDELSFIYISAFPPVLNIFTKSSGLR